MNRQHNVKFTHSSGQRDLVWCDSNEMKLWVCLQVTLKDWESDPDDYYEALNVVMSERAPA
jgi:hypothetical protein